MERDIYRRLLEWKASPRRKPLVLKGARQVGKTYILQEFGRREYERVAYFNFEETPALDDFFQRSLDPQTVLPYLSLQAGMTIRPGRDLIIFDEIQVSIAALNSLKYFHEKAGEYHVAAAGSLLGIMMSQPKSFPVGKVNLLNMYPLTFLEFLDAIGKNGLRRLIETRVNIEPLPLTFHQQLTDDFLTYLFVGGMPEPVQLYLETRDFTAIRTTQKEIMDTYALDFTKHSTPADIPKIKLIWDSIPAQLAKENKKFIFSAVKKSARAREYEKAVQWLEDAGLIIKSYRVSTAKCPLKGYRNRSSFKVFSLDVGLLGALANLPVESLVEGERIGSEYRGALIENFVAQQLHSEKELDLYYWASNGRAEVDFLIEFNGKIYPLEAKAGVNPKSKSLKLFGEKFHSSVLFRTTLLNLRRDGKIVNLPLYAVSRFPEIYSG
jgi:hypothetical protein